MKWALAFATARVFDEKHGFSEMFLNYLRYHLIIIIKKDFYEETFGRDGL